MGGQPHMAADHLDEVGVVLGRPDGEAMADQPQHQPDQPQAELDELMRLARVFDDDVAAGRRPGPDDYYPDPFGTDCQENFIATSAETLRQAAAAVNYKTIVGD